jgi:hypothetical protein
MRLLAISPGVTQPPKRPPSSNKQDMHWPRPEMTAKSTTARSPPKTLCTSKSATRLLTRLVPSTKIHQSHATRPPARLSLSANHALARSLTKALCVNTSAARQRMSQSIPSYHTSPRVPEATPDRSTSHHNDSPASSLTIDRTSSNKNDLCRHESDSQ